jgi:Putative adhesin
MGKLPPIMTQLPRLLAAAGILAALTSNASAKVERVVEKSFQVDPGVHLRVSTSGGEIRVDPLAGNTVRVTAREHIRASSEADADLVLQKLDLVIEQHGNEVVASASIKDDGNFHFGSWPPVEVDFIVTVPPSASVDLKTSGGDIAVGDLGGTVLARTSGGEINLGKIGGEVDATTSGGNVGLAAGQGRVKLSTSGGTITAGRLAGPAELRTSGGDIKVEAVEDTVKAHTSGGDVRVMFEGRLKGDSSLTTSGGDVRATVGPEAGFHLAASTSGGDVRADGLTITIEHGGVGKSSLSGDVNGGGPLLELRTSGGDVNVVVHRGSA